MKKRLIAGLVCTAAAISVPAWSAQGEYWELSTKMEMSGMPFAMPAQTVKVCIAKGAEQDPRASADKSCEVMDVKSSGNKTSWKVRCNQNGDIMTGVGESSGSADKNEGTIRLSGVSHGTKIDMTQTYSNKRIGGACDTEEQTKKIMAQVCDTSGYDTAQWIYGAERFIRDTGNACPGKKEKACDVARKEPLRDEKAYVALVTADKNNGGLIAKACGINMDTTTKSICKTFNASNADTLGAYCPAEAKVYRENERRKACEGRSYTAKEDLGKCLTGDAASATGKAVLPKAADSAKKSTDAAAPPAEGSTPSPEVVNPAAAIMDSAKKLKGLFGL